MTEHEEGWNAALEFAAGLADKSVNDGGLAKSMAFFLSSEEWKAYRKAVKDYQATILECKFG